MSTKGCRQPDGPPCMFERTCEISADFRRCHHHNHHHQHQPSLCGARWLSVEGSVGGAYLLTFGACTVIQCWRTKECLPAFCTSEWKLFLEPSVLHIFDSRSLVYPSYINMTTLVAPKISCQKCANPRALMISKEYKLSLVSDCFDTPPARALC